MSSPAPPSGDRNDAPVLPFRRRSRVVLRESPTSSHCHASCANFLIQTPTSALDIPRRCRWSIELGSFALLSRAEYSFTLASGAFRNHCSYPDRSTINHLEQALEVTL